MQETSKNVLKDTIENPIKEELIPTKTPFSVEKELSFPAMQVILANRLQVEKLKQKYEKERIIARSQSSSLKDVKGLGPNTIERLVNAGIETINDLKLTPRSRLFEIVENPFSRKQLVEFLETHKDSV